MLLLPRGVGMIVPTIIYLGTAGLDADTFQSYMRSSGYAVHIVPTRERALAALEAQPAAIAVIAADRKPRELIKLARDLRAHMPAAGSHIFILGGQQPFETGLPSVEVVPRPFRLAEVSRRIQAITRDASPR